MISPDGAFYSYTRGDAWTDLAKAEADPSRPPPPPPRRNAYYGTKSRRSFQELEELEAREDVQSQPERGEGSKCNFPSDYSHDHFRARRPKSSRSLEARAGSSTNAKTKAAAKAKAAVDHNSWRTHSANDHLKMQNWNPQTGVRGSRG